MINKDRGTCPVSRSSLSLSKCSCIRKRCSSGSRSDRICSRMYLKTRKKVHFKTGNGFTDWKNYTANWKPKILQNHTIHVLILNPPPVSQFCKLQHGTYTEQYNTNINIFTQHKTSIIFLPNSTSGSRWVALQSYLALQLSDSLGLINDWRPFFPINCFLLQSVTLHLPQILLSSHLSLGLLLVLLPSGLRSYISLTSLPWSILTTYPTHSNPFILISAATSRSLYSSLNSWLVHIHHIPCSNTAHYILLNIFLSYIPSLVISISAIAPVSLLKTTSGFTFVLYILILTALLMALALLHTW